MKYCPECTCEYENSIEKCADCGILLVNELPVSEVQELQESDLTLVYRCDQLYKAQMIKSNLESAGIESYILSQKESSFPGVGDLAVIKLYVINKDAETALEFIRKSESTQIENDED